MAWKVIGFHNAARDAVGGNRPQYYKEGVRAVVFGPHPRKVWVREPGKRNKMPRLPKVTHKTGERAKDVTARMAVEYARWLAARDGIVIPKDSKGVALWAHVTTPSGKIEDRVSAVSWHHNGAYARDKGSMLARVDIPNWDWTPAQPIETLEYELALAA